VKEWSLKDIREVLKLGEGYIHLKKRGCKGLVGHPSDRRKCGIFFSFFIFRTLFLSLFPFCHFISCRFILFLFLTTINLLMFVLIRKDCC
jgi:hypothetical protein